MPPAVVAVVGGGPAGLMAAEAAAKAGATVHVFDAMPSMGRKFLMAGKSGLNLTHAEPAKPFLDRYGLARKRLEPIIAAFGPGDLRAWVHDLGVETFVGSSGRVFPVDFKAAPLLRTWLRRLRGAGVLFHARHRWMGWNANGVSVFRTPDGDIAFPCDSFVIALGGASWPQLGSDGAWVPLLRGRDVTVSALQPANCGFDIGWSDFFRERFAGQPVKTVAIESDSGKTRGELVITEHGIEGSGIYPHSAALRDRIATDGRATVTLDLLPDRSMAWVAQTLDLPRGSRSLAEHLRRTLGLTGVKAGLLREVLTPAQISDVKLLVRTIKNFPLTLTAPRPIAEAISSAGGIAWAALTDDLMIRDLPGVFAAGEMLDWEAMTGGYLLTACLALGRAAGRAAAEWALRPAEL
jgi:uncharacterized flavoprotein (TIGR03862 family)